MGTISSGIGLISGMNIDDLVTKLMAIESQPLTQLQSEISTTQKEQSDYSSLSSNLATVLAAIKTLSQVSSFGARTATSSNTGVVTATAGANTPLGNYSFQVRSLATTHQVVSGGFTDLDQTPLTPGTLTFKSSGARVDTSTPLAELNGMQGVSGGVIRITDRAGGTANVDLTAAVSIDDVLQAINGQSTANVKASIDGDRLVLTDETGATTGSLSVQDLSGGSAAAGLGIAGTSTTGELDGRDVVQLSNNTNISMLNDGIGLRTNGYGNDIQFTTSDGQQISWIFPAISRNRPSWLR